MKTLQRTLATLVLLGAASISTAPASVALPAKGTEILWDRYGIPHIFAPDHASLFYAYGYAQMEAHSELLVRLYTQARGRARRTLRRAVSRFRPLGARQRHSRTGQAVGHPAVARIRAAAGTPSSTA